MDGRRAGAAVGIVLVAGGAVAAYGYAARPPRPAVLPLPPHHRIVDVEGTCWGGGSELFSCETDGPRALIDVRGPGVNPGGEFRTALLKRGYNAIAGISPEAYEGHGVRLTAVTELLCPAATERPVDDCFAVIQRSEHGYRLGWYRQRRQ